MGSYSNETTLSPKGEGEDLGNKSYGYVIATTVLLMVAMAIVGLVFVYRMYRKRSGPLWITKLYVQDPYSSMTNDDSNPRDEQFIIGFSNPIMESVSEHRDGQDGGVKVLGYKPLNTEKQPGEKDNDLEQYKFLFPREKLVFGPEIGTGWFGKVYKGEALRIVPGLRKTKVIIKKLKDDSTSQLRTRFVQETEMLKSLKHENVLGIIGKATEKEPYIVVFERNPMGNLKEFLITHKHSAESLRNKCVPLRMASDIASGLQYLHSNSIYHNDLAARNCVVDADLSVKIGDYGISRYLYENDYYRDPNSTEDSVPIRWLEPESVSYQKDSGLTVESPTARSNVWSYGVTVWEIIEFGRQPYEELTDEEVIQTVIIDQLYQLPEPNETGTLAYQMYETMRWCWVEASRRPSIQEMTSYLTAFKENFPFSNTVIDKFPQNDSSEQMCTTNPDDTCDILERNEARSSTDVTASPITKETGTKDILDDFPTSEPCEITNPFIGKEKTDDIEITEICDDDPVPITVINTTGQNGQNVENTPSDKQAAEDYSESCEKQEKPSSASEGECGLFETNPPVTYIGDPSDGLAEYERRIAVGIQDVIDPVTVGNEIVQVKFSGSEPSVIVENCASGYVVLPGELVRRKSSLRRENAQSRGQSVHFPANILDLRVVHRYYKEEEEDEEDEEEEEDGQVLARDIINGDVTDKHGNCPLADTHDGRPHDLLITGQVGLDNPTSSTLERPVSPVEKKIRKGSRRKKLNQHSDEWLFCLDQER